MSHHLFILGIAAATICVPLRAQIGRGAISGSVRDSSDAVVINAQVDVVHQETNTVSTVRSNNAGLFSAPGLSVGHYRLKVSAPGFRQAVRSNIELRVDDHPELDFVLEIGATSESVEVSAAAPLVDIQGATVGKVIERTRIENLPLNGRSAMALIVQTPNVRSQAVNAAGFSDRGGVVTAVSVNGGPAATNNYIIDGNSNINPRGGDASVNPAVDAIQEFKVQSGTMSSEYGFTAGGVVNIVTRSGTNQFHGSLYEYLRNDAFDARNAFAAVKPPFRYNQYGGTVGGPVRKDRTFFFYNYEEWRYSRSYTVLNTVPTAAERTGDFSSLRSAAGALIPVYDPATTRANPSGSGFIRDAFAGNVVPVSRLDAVAQKAIAFFPLPNQAPSNVFTHSNNFLANLGSVRKARQMTAKADHRFSDKNALSFHYMLWDHKDDNGTSGTLLFPDPVVRDRNDNYSNRNATVNDIHTIAPNLLHEFRFGVVRLYFPFLSAAAGGDWPQKLGLPASGNVPDITFPKMSIQGYQAFPGIGTGNGLISADGFQWADSLTWIHRKHSFKFGLDLRRNRYNQAQCSNCSGAFSFDSVLTGNPQVPAGTGAGLASFVLGAVANANIDVTQPVTYKNLSQAYFVQDDWKILRRLTLNLGLRYDYQQPGTESFNRLSNFNPFAINPENGLLGRLEYGDKDFSTTPVHSDYLNFGPRFGFAYDLTGNGRTAIRGGYGIFYPFSFSNSLPSSFGFGSSTTTYLPAGGNTQLAALQLRGGFPFQPTQPQGAALGPSALQSQNVTYVQTDGSQPYSQQWTVSIQRQLPGGWLLESGYSGNKGTHLLTAAWDYNQLDPVNLTLGSALQNSVPNPYAGKVAGAFGGATITKLQSLRPYPYYSQIAVTTPRQGSSIYHSWFIDLERRMSNGFVLLTSYSFGKLIDENILSSSATGSELISAGAAYSSGRYNRRVDRGLDSIDPAGRFVLSGVYELPIGAGKRWRPANGTVRALAGGWQINTAILAENGQPLVIRGANNNLADRPNSTGKSAALSNPTLTKWFDTAQFVNPPNYTFGTIGRTLPDVRNPGQFTVDLSVIKNTRIKERFTVQFRAEAFNALNRLNPLGPDVSFSAGPNGLNQSGTFGTISGSRDPRVMQLALKLLF